MRNFFRTLWRRLLGKHPVYEWGACSEWSLISSIVNRTIRDYIANTAADMIGDDLKRLGHMKRLMKTNRVDFAGPEVRFEFNVKKKSK